MTGLRWLRLPRSFGFLFVYGIYLAVLGLGQRLVIWPLVALLPARRDRIVRAWLRAQAWLNLAMARVLADVRVTVEGTIPAESVVVVMNHQSVLDIPLGISLMPGPQVLIPTRLRYKYGIPGISPLTRLARFPLLSQSRVLPREELASLRQAADRVHRGACSLLMFPEGHRTRTGEIGPFMRAGLRLVLEHANRPVYAVVVDGIWGARRMVDAAGSIAGSRVRMRVLGPWPAPNADEVDGFIERLHEQMRDALVRMRGAQA